MNFRDSEKARHQRVKADLFSADACRPGTYNGIARDFCLADSCASENLFQRFRRDAIDYFCACGIPWHDGGADSNGQARRLPSNHLCCSQCACVNSLWPLTSRPELLLRVLRRYYPEMAVPLPFEAGRPLPDGSIPYIVFEWIGGTERFLSEKGWGTQGANCTSADFAFRFRRTDGLSQVVLGEWKYTEEYGGLRLDCGKPGKTRLDTYEGPFARWQPGRTDLPPYETYFVEPFYQLMRLGLLANEMERAGCAGGGMQADVVTVLHVAPRANTRLRTNLQAVPALRDHGATLGEAWTWVAPTGRFLSVDSESLMTSLAQEADDDLRGWGDYLTRRYGWWLDQTTHA